MNSGILELSARVLFFPVRHHSPACARAVREFIQQYRPSAVLIEGPSDFNSRVEELFFDHELPIAIYSWISPVQSDATAPQLRRGAFYPFCVYSPEWQALQSARAIGVTPRFIDLPWGEMATSAAPAHRYAEPELRGSPYVTALCQKLGTPDLDALWDRLFEIENLSAQEVWERCHHFCYGVRVADSATPPEDLQREAYMTAQIERALQEENGRILVITGGFHSYALYARLNGLPFDHDNTENNPESESNVPEESLEFERGMALTPYSYERLDSLRGYEAGMPSPGFYDRVWQVREGQQTQNGSIHRQLLAHTVKSLRKRKQTASSADLIAALTTARALANLRGHSEVWRRDLIDGILGALVKDELESGGTHPFLEAVYEALRGNARGRISTSAPVPPLVADVLAIIKRFDLEVQVGERQVELDLAKEDDLERSRILHRLRVVGIAGYNRTGGSDFVARGDLSRATEQWTLKWTPETQSASVEASIYGATLHDAALARLSQRAAEIEHDSEVSALLLLDAALMGLTELAAPTLTRLIDIIRHESDFFRLASALDHLLYLFHFDATLESSGAADIGATLRESWERGVWLLEMLGSPQGRDKDLIQGVVTLVRVLERCETLELNREEFVAVLGRISQSESHSPLLRGATSGALWTLGETSSSETMNALPAFAQPAQLGDFLTGLFALAREAAQRHPELVKGVDELLAAFDDDRFLEALPALRLAFSYFTPREKHYMALTLMEGQATPLPDLTVGIEVAARALAIESQLFETLKKYGLRPTAKPTSRSNYE